MCTWTSNTTFDGDPRRVALALIDIDATVRWSPVPFRLINCRGRRLRRGAKPTNAGALMGRRVSCKLDVTRADRTGLSLYAKGPFEMDVNYVIDPVAAELSARVETRGGGLFAKILVSATNALLAAGALDGALQRVVQQAHQSSHASLCGALLTREEHTATARERAAPLTDASTRAATLVVRGAPRPDGPVSQPR